MDVDEFTRSIRIKRGEQKIIIEAMNYARGGK